MHVLFSCNLYSSQRRQLFIDLYDLDLSVISFRDIFALGEKIRLLWEGSIKIFALCWII